MAVQPEQPAEEIKRLRRCLNDLVSVLALPAIWIGGDPSQIVNTLLDVLLRMLRLDLVYVQLKDPVGEAPIEMVRLVDLNEATREVIALSLSELQRKKVVLRAELADDLPPVTGDRVQLQQVVLNLLINASDAMSGVDDRPRHLVIRTARDEGDRVRLTVQDSGVGFEPRGVDKLFEAFYTTKSGGMGIGLSVSRSIIENHHGRLWAAPNEGPGAMFSFSINSTGPMRTPAMMDAADVMRNP